MVFDPKPGLVYDRQPDVGDAIAGCVNPLVAGFVVWLKHAGRGVSCHADAIFPAWRREPQILLFRTQERQRCSQDF